MPEFNDRRSPRFHVLTRDPGQGVGVPAALHSTHGDYSGAARALNSEAGAHSWIAGDAEAERMVPGFNSQLHTTCDYCTKPATHIGRDTGETICHEHGKEMYESPRDSLSKLTPRTLKMYGRPSRF